MPVTATAVTPLRRQYPHLDQMPSFHVQATIRLLWDQIFDLREQLVAAQGTIAALTAAVNALQTDTGTDRRDIDQALAPTQEA